jgi:hypothetical protein
MVLAARDPDLPALAVGVMLFGFTPILYQPVPATRNSGTLVMATWFFRIEEPKPARSGLKKLRQIDSPGLLAAGDGKKVGVHMDF